MLFSLEAYHWAPASVARSALFFQVLHYFTHTSLNYLDTSRYIRKLLRCSMCSRGRLLWKLPETPGKNPLSQARMAQVEVWMSLAAWSVAEQRNAGSFELYPVCCSAIARSIPAPHSAPRRQSQQNHLWKIKLSLVFFARRSLWTHFSFSTHSLCVLSPPSFAGVSCFALLLPHGAAHADPRREGEKGEPNAYCSPKIVYDRGQFLGLYERPTDSYYS